MSAATDNNENAVRETKRNEDYKSPGRLMAEEKAEKIRYAEEYRKKLEAEAAAVPPKKTKAAEQKEQEKIEKAERELEERRAELKEQTESANKHISDAIQKIEALKEKIESTEAEIVADSGAVTVSSVSCEAEEVSASEEKESLVVRIPIMSFKIPCVVKTNQNPPVPPMCPPPAMLEYPRAMTYIRPKADRSPKISFLSPAKSSVKASEQKKSEVRTIDVTADFRRDGAYKPAITYGTPYEGRWGSDILTEGEETAQDIFTLSADATPAADNSGELIAELASTAAAADTSAFAAQEIAAQLESGVAEE